MSKKEYSIGYGQSLFPSKKRLRKRAKDILSYNEEELREELAALAVGSEASDEEILVAISDFLGDKVYVIEVKPRSEFISDKKLIAYTRKLLFGSKEKDPSRKERALPSSVIGTVVRVNRTNRGARVKIEGGVYSFRFTDFYSGYPFHLPVVGEKVSVLFSGTTLLRVRSVHTKQAPVV